MKRLFLLLFALLPMLVSAQNSTSDNNVIRYTTTDNEVLNTEVVCNASLISNTYADGQGVMVFDKPITEIGWDAFKGCTSLTSITIPNSVTMIGNRAFKGCTSLKSFYGKFASEDNRCLIKDGKMLAFAPNGLTEYTIPDSVTEIGGNAFDGCTSLKSFYGKFASEDNRCLIEDGVLSAFAPNGLTEYTIPNSVTYIGSFAFQGCTSLKSITIPNSVTEIGQVAFYCCTSLKSVTIPNSVTEIGEGAFSGCTSLESFYGKFASEDNRCLIKDGVLLAFAPNGLTEYTIPNSVTKIGWGAFLGCNPLKSITIPNSVTLIGRGAFYNCTSLKSVTIPNSVTKIEGYAFIGCTSLESVKIPNSVTLIGDNAFNGCTSLENVYCKPTTPPRGYLINTFHDNKGKPLGCKIHVPRASVEAYKTAEGWKEHADNIVGYDF